MKYFHYKFFIINVIINLNSNELLIIILAQECNLFCKARIRWGNVNYYVKN